MRSLLFAALLDVALASQVHIIDVSNRANAPIFFPDNIVIPLGDVVQFQFQGGNHSATQSAFNTPCQAVAGGFDSGFQPFFGAVVPVFTFAINNTDPIYYFSGSPGDCEKGMVGGINGPSTGNTVQAYQAAAFKLAPPPNSLRISTTALPKSTKVQTIISSLTSSSPTSSVTQYTTPTLSASNSNTTTPMAENHCDNCLPTPVIVGIAIGVVSVVLMAMGLWRLWKRKKDISRRNATLGSTRMVTEDDVARFRMRDFGFEEQPVEVRAPPKRPKRPERVSKWVT